MGKTLKYYSADRGSFYFHMVNGFSKSTYNFTFNWSFFIYYEENIFPYRLRSNFIGVDICSLLLF